MKLKDMAALIAVSGILIQVAPSAATAGQGTHQPLQMIIELAGADEPDRATPEQLRRADQQMVPSESMKKAMPKSEPSAMPAASEPAAPMKTAEDADKMPAKAMPAAETKPETPAEKPAPAKQPMKTAMQPSTPAGPYVRGDIGYGFASDPDGTTSAGAMSGESVGDAALFGVGIGYRFSPNFRADATVDFRADANVDATTSGGTAVTSEVNGWTLMANAYWDIGDFNGITPYVGAGMGYARLETSDQVGGNAEPSATNDNLAWAGMLGLAIATGVPGAAIDVGYRYIQLGDFKQDGGASYDDLAAHEVRAGFRYQF